MKTKISALRINSDTLATLGFYSLLLLGGLLSASNVQATDLLGNQSVHVLIEQVEMFRLQEKYQSNEQRNVMPTTAFNMVDIRNNENSYIPKYTLNHNFNIVEVDSNTSLILNDEPFLAEVQGGTSDGKDASLFSESGSNNFSNEIEGMN
jgi:hypothetical protein